MRASPLLFLPLLWSLAHSQQIFPYVSFIGQTLTNHSYVDISLVGSDASGSNSVQCHTDLETCCSVAQGMHRGDWYFPSGARQRFSDSPDDIYEHRVSRRVDIRRRSNDEPTGIYRCDISTFAVHHSTDISVRDRVYVGLYATNEGNW